MNRISFFSVCFFAIGSIIALLCTVLGFYKCVPMWAFTALFVVYSVIHISMYCLQKRDETVKFQRFQKLRLGVMILLVGWVLGTSYIAMQSSPQRSIREIMELWVERIKAI